ncbi:hypothetical protein [Flavivirga jejuensis]|uniref:GDP-L-fucose synthase n=1 Tax=Flavivirga jejuensis TaxID=870487 RepID=A0ABT8WU12_9FLAO|nr:hypothetical protein [Flavivirga jejuensis]MDO5976376.1 hypothetical protein [Flavivirga jejuensis]
MNTTKIALITGITGQDGTPRKLLDVSKLNKLGWKAEIELKQGIINTYNWYCNNIETIRKTSIK